MKIKTFYALYYRHRFIKASILLKLYLLITIVFKYTYNLFFLPKTTNLDIISRKKICEQIGISRDTIRNWIEKRDFPKPLKSSGRDPLFQLKEVNEWFLKHGEDNEN